MSYKFNMVEIALAIVVIAIGLSSILVLFPIGIKATRSAVEENVVPDIASVVVNFIRGEYLKNWDNARGQFPTLNVENNKQNSFERTPLGQAQNKNSEKTPQYSETFIFSNEKNGGLKSSDIAGVYQYYKETKDSDGKVVDEFTATVQIWRPSSTDLTVLPKQDGTDEEKIKTQGNCPLFLWDMYEKNGTFKTAPNILYDSGKGNSNLGDHPKLSGDTEGVFEKFADSVLVEISYGDVKKTFRVDLYNPSYEIKIL